MVLIPNLLMPGLEVEHSRSPRGPFWTGYRWFLTQTAVLHQDIERTAPRRFEIRNLRILIIRKRLHLHPGAQTPAVTRTGCSAIWVAIWDFSKSRKNVNPEPISKGYELLETHWTSPLGPLASGVGLDLQHGAKHSLPGLLNPKSGRKK